MLERPGTIENKIRQQFFDIGLKGRKYHSGYDILDAITNACSDKPNENKPQFFGIVHCDLEIPKWDKTSRDLYVDCPPIFKNTLISRKDVGKHMRGYLEANDIMRKPRRSLVASYFAKDLVLISPMIDYLMKHHVKVYIHSVGNCTHHLSINVCR